LGSFKKMQYWTMALTQQRTAVHLMPPTHRGSRVEQKAHAQLKSNTTTTYNNKKLSATSLRMDSFHAAALGAQMLSRGHS